MNELPRIINRIFGGLMLVLVDVNVIIDILPDFIGYFMIASALGKLQPVSAHFFKAKIFALLLAIISIPYLFVPQMNLLEGIQPSFFIILVNTIISLLHITFAFYLLHGLVGLAKNSNLSSLAQKAYKRGTFYIIVSLAATAIMSFIFNVTESTAYFLIITGAVAYLIVEIMLLVLIREFRTINS